MINKYNKILIILLLVILTMSGLWAIDIGASALITNNNVQGLLGVRSASTQYHIGLGLCFMSFFILCCMYLYEILKKENIVRR